MAPGALNPSARSAPIRRSPGSPDTAGRAHPRACPARSPLLARRGSGRGDDLIQRPVIALDHALDVAIGVGGAEEAVVGVPQDPMGQQAEEQGLAQARVLADEVADA